MSYSHTQYETDALDRHLSLWDYEPESVEPYYARRLRVMGERNRRLREAKRLNEVYLKQITTTKDAK